MPLIANMTNAQKTGFTVTTDHGKATVRLFKPAGACTNPEMLMLVSHGYQPTPARTVPGPYRGIASFAFLVPLRVSLKRTRYDNWAHELATQFSSAPLAFACAGTPDLVVGAHFIEPEDKNYASALEKALPVCHIAVLDDFLVAESIDRSYKDCSGLPLASLLEGTPNLRLQYSSFLLHCCRSPWNPEATKKSTGDQATPQGLFAFDDRFRTTLE